MTKLHLPEHATTLSSSPKLAFGSPLKHFFRYFSGGKVNICDRFLIFLWDYYIVFGNDWKNKERKQRSLSSVGLWLAGHEAHDMSFNRTREAHRKKKTGDYYSHVRCLMHQKIFQKIIYASLGQLLHARWASVAILFMRRIASYWTYLYTL